MLRCPLETHERKQLRAARVLSGWDQAKLAKAAWVGIGTVRRMESFDGAINSQTGTLFKVQAALERGGIEFLDDDRPGVRLRASTIKRQDGR